MKCTKHPRYKGLKKPTTKLDCECREVYNYNNYKECQDCLKYKEDVSLTICPFALDVRGVVEKITVCDICYDERNKDI